MMQKFLKKIHSTTLTIYLIILQEPWNFLGDFYIMLLNNWIFTAILTSSVHAHLNAFAEAAGLARFAPVLVDRTRVGGWTHVVDRLTCKDQNDYSVNSYPNRSDAYEITSTQYPLI